MLIRSLCFRNRVKPLPLTEANLAKLAHPAETQIDVWNQTQETHERSAVGEKTLRDPKETQTFVKDVEKNVLGLKQYWRQ